MTKNRKNTFITYQNPDFFKKMSFNHKCFDFHEISLSEKYLNSICEILPISKFH